LDIFLNGKHIPTCCKDTFLIREGLMNAIWRNQCASYAKLISQIRPKMLEEEKLELLPIETLPSGKLDIRW
jgi:hypothetical protein